MNIFAATDVVVALLVGGAAGASLAGVLWSRRLNRAHVQVARLLQLLVEQDVAAMPMRDTVVDAALILAETEDAYDAGIASEDVDDEAIAALGARADDALERYRRAKAGG